MMCGLTGVVFGGEDLQLRFQPRRTLQAAAHLLSLSEGPVPARRLLDWLYATERRWFSKTGDPITGDQFIMTEDGPTLLETRRLLTATDSPWTPWIATGDEVRLVGDPGEGELSRGVERTLREIHGEFCDLRTLPEWRRYFQLGLEVEVPWDELLRLAGVPDRHIVAMEKDLSYYYWVDDIAPESER